MKSDERNPVISLRGGVIRDESRRFREPVDFTLNADEHLAIVGLNGSGKTVLVETLLGLLYLEQGELRYDFGEPGGKACDHIRHVTFRDAYGTADRGYYYQQRWNSSDREEAPLALEALGHAVCDPQWRDELFAMLDMDRLLDKRIVLLSSGELRRFQIAKMLLASPRVLFVESPFIGLDAAARETLERLFRRLTERTDVRVVWVVSSPDDVPSFVTHVYVVDDRRCGPKQTREEFVRGESLSARRADLAGRYARQAPVLPEPLNAGPDCDEVARLRNVTIRYGGRTILDSVDWTVRRGEKWTLTGANGSGKSTLLSLLCADNPQAYAQDISLFGRRRGTGESIWDIKRRIGYVSPEMHRSYVKDIPAVDIVASGFFDTIGLYRTPDDAQRAVCERWMDAFGIRPLRDRSFLRLSSGEQRLLLLARAFVKDPDLLILDEPLHGLDCCNKERARAVIAEFCRRPGKTMIYVTHYERELPDCINRRMELPRRG